MSSPAPSPGPSVAPSAGPARGPASPWGVRLRLTGYAAAQLLWAIPALVLFVVDVVGGVLAIIVLGLAVLVWSLPASRWIAGLHRRWAAEVLGIEVESPYRPAPEERNVFARLRWYATDPMTWRDHAWVLWTVTLGFALSLTALLLAILLVTGLLWWFGIEPMMRARARIDLFFLARGRTEQLEERVAVLAESRAETVDHSAAELRRIERDLHDGAQARLVALGMSLGMAEDLLERDPDAARRLISDARDSTRTALGDLRSVVRGIHPPVLADRGLVGAVRALALDMALDVEVRDELTGRFPAPVESAVYFAVAECLANIGKHAGAEHGWVHLAHADGRLRVTVGDDGRGGADPDGGTGIRGVMRRLAALDGTMRVASPGGGPTVITLEVPCTYLPSSSPRTTPSSGRA